MVKKVPTPEEISRERDEIRTSIVESLRLIVQSQYILADLQENQRRLEALLAALSTEVEDSHDPAPKAASQENDSTSE